MHKLILFVAAMAYAGLAMAQPAFKGGSTALDAFLSGHIVYPEYSSRNCISATVQVGFRVDRSGQVFDVKVLNGPGIDLDDEALRVVKLTSGKWMVPAGYNGPFNMVLPIHFTPDYSHCTNAIGRDIEEAITAYKNRQELENAVTNYYQNKYQGKADTTKEQYIIALKKQLGFDDELIDDVLKQANTKLKQGDKEGACTDWAFIHNIGSSRADQLIAQYCK